MKKYLLISLTSLFFILTGCSSQNKLAKAGIEFVEGTDLKYEINSEGEKYSFDININHFSENSISFDWDMGFRSGTVAMFGQALVNSADMFNYFSGGYTELEDKTSVWISKELFENLKAGKAVEIGLGKGVKETFIYQGPETFSFGDRNEGVPYNIPVFVIATKNGEKEIWIADDPKNRLIVMMNIDFRIDLVAYKPY